LFDIIKKRKIVNLKDIYVLKINNDS